MSKQFVEPLIAENAKLKETIKLNKAIILENILTSNNLDAETKAKIMAEFLHDDNGAKIRWNEEDEGWEDICGDCNKPWCKGGEYDDDNQWFCEDCYVTPSDSEDEDDNSP